MGAAPASSSSQGPSACTPPPGGGRVPASSGCHGERTHWEAWRPRRPPRVLLPLPTGHSRTPFLTAGGLAGPPGSWSRGLWSPAEAQSSGGVGGPPQAEAPEAGRHPLGSRRAQSTGRTRPSPVCFAFSENSQESGPIGTRPARGGPRVLACARRAPGPDPGWPPPEDRGVGGIRTGPASEAGGLVAGALGGAGADPLGVQQSRTMSDAQDPAQAPAAPPAVAARPLHSPAAWCSACWAGRPGWRQRGAGAPPPRRPARRAPCRPRPLAGRVPGGRVHARAHTQGRTRAGGLALRLRPAEGEAVRCGGGGSRPPDGCPDMSVQPPLWERGRGLASAQVPGNEGAPQEQWEWGSPGPSLGRVLPSSSPRRPCCLD